MNWYYLWNYTPSQKLWAEKQGAEWVVSTCVWVGRYIFWLKCRNMLDLCQQKVVGYMRVIAKEESCVFMTSLCAVGGCLLLLQGSSTVLCISMLSGQGQGASHFWFSLNESSLALEKWQVNGERNQVFDFLSFTRILFGADKSPKQKAICLSPATICHKVVDMVDFFKVQPDVNSMQMKGSIYKVKPCRLHI